MEWKKNWKKVDKLNNCYFYVDDKTCKFSFVMVKLINFHKFLACLWT